MGNRELGKYKPRTAAEESGAREEMERVLTKKEIRGWPYNTPLGNTAIVLFQGNNEDGAMTAIVTLEQSWEAAYERS